MKKILLLLFVIALGFTACEGRMSKSQALKKSITEFKSDSIIETVSYFPEEYYENLSDSILNNGFRVKIKFFSNMQNSFKKTYTEDSIKYTNIYREFNAEVDILYNEKHIFHRLLDKQYLAKESGIPEERFDKLRLENMWIDESESDNHSRIDILYAEIAGGDIVTIHLKLTVDKNGNYNINEVKYLNDYKHVRA